MQFSKRASLEISIQAIVIIVLAMTLLGLGLGFIRGQFKTITETAGTVQEQVKQQIMDDLRSSDKKLSFPTNEVIIQKKDSKILAVGVKNTKASQLNFQIILKTIDDAGVRQDITNLGDSPDGDFIYNKGVQSLGVNEPRAYPIKYTAPVNVITKTFEIVVCDCGTAATPCTVSGPGVACDIASGATEYDSKTFFMTIT